MISPTWSKKSTTSSVRIMSLVKELLSILEHYSHLTTAASSSDSQGYDWVRFVMVAHHVDVLNV